MINNVTLVGRITKELTLSQGKNSGKPFCRFTIAVNRPFTKEGGEREADFISAKVFGKQAESLVQYQGKGSLIGIVGRIETGSFDGQDGKRVYTTEVIADTIQFLEPKAQNKNSNAQQPSNANANYQPQPNYNQPPSQQQWNPGYNQNPQYNQGNYQQPQMNQNYGQNGNNGYPPNPAYNQAPPQYSNVGAPNWDNGPVSEDELPF